MRHFSQVVFVFAALFAVACTNGSSSCPSGRRLCPGSDVCVNLDSDTLNCGSCGHACSGTDVCLAGTCGPLHPGTDGGTDAGRRDGSTPVDMGIPELCMPTCGASQRCCGTECVYRIWSGGANTDGTMDTSFFSCGACGRSCDPNTANQCGMGSAGPACQCGIGGACITGQNCVNTGTGYACQTNCGGMGACATGQACCGTGAAQACTDLSTDVNNCGGCGHACSASQVCTAGHCADLCGGVACAAGELCCADTCTPSDASNCGACGYSCPIDSATGMPEACGMGLSFTMPGSMSLCCVLGGGFPGFMLCDPMAGSDGGGIPFDLGVPLDAGTPAGDP